MATLDLNGNYAEQMLSLYLWGQDTAPSPSDIADEKFIRTASATTTADIDATSYMNHVGNHFQLAEQKMFQTRCAFDFKGASCSYHRILFNFL